MRLSRGLIAFGSGLLTPTAKGTSLPSVWETRDISKVCVWFGSRRIARQLRWQSCFLLKWESSRFSLCKCQSSEAGNCQGQSLPRKSGSWVVIGSWKLSHSIMTINNKETIQDLLLINPVFFHLFMSSSDVKDQAFYKCSLLSSCYLSWLHDSLIQPQQRFSGKNGRDCSCFKGTWQIVISKPKDIYLKWGGNWKTSMQNHGTVKHQENRGL